MKGDVYMYGIVVRVIPGTVMMRFAFLPTVIEPASREIPMAYAPLMVQALKDCEGVSLSRMQPRDITILISPEGEDPGLKSEARAIPSPSPMNSFTLAKGIPRKKMNREAWSASYPFP